MSTLCGKVASQGVGVTKRNKEIQRAFLFPIWQPLSCLTLGWSKADAFLYPGVSSFRAMLSLRMLICLHPAVSPGERMCCACGRDIFLGGWDISAVALASLILCDVKGQWCYLKAHCTKGFLTWHGKEEAL